MSFDSKSWLLDTLVRAYESGQFTKEYVTVLANNYKCKGALGEEDLAYLAGKLGDAGGTPAPGGWQAVQEQPTVGVIGADGELLTGGAGDVYNRWTHIKTTCHPGEKMRTTAGLRGDATALLSYWDAQGAFLFRQYEGVNNTTNRYEDYEFTVPEGAYSVAVTSYTADTPDFKLERYVEGGVQPQSRTSWWQGKKIVWFGTSIPAGGYPGLVGKRLGAVVVNEAVGNSMARIGDETKITADDPHGWTGAHWEKVAYSLAMHLSEKQALIDGWDSWKTKLSGSPPNALTEAQKTQILGCSYEKKLVERHLGEGKRADLYVFDHGHNDAMNGAGAGTLDTVPADPLDRHTFIGAMGFLVAQILEDNPRARICFVGHYEDARKAYIVKAQRALAACWSFPLLPLWERLGFSQQKITTTGYWGTDGVWVESGGESRQVTMTQMYMKDDLHPSSDLSGKTNALIADALAALLEEIR